jgi:hypothetical protein
MPQNRRRGIHLIRMAAESAGVFGSQSRETEEIASRHRDRVSASTSRCLGADSARRSKRGRDVLLPPWQRYFGDICGSILPKSVGSAIVLSRYFANSGDPVQNVKPTDLPCISDHLSPISAVINRVAAIAPAPLLPGEKQPTMRALRCGSSEPQSREMRLRNS